MGSRRQRMLPGEGSVWTRPRPSPSRRVADSPLARTRRACFSAAGNQGVGLVPRLVTRSPAPSSTTVTSHCTLDTANLSASASIPRRRHTARPICVEDAGSGSSPPSAVTTNGMSPRARARVTRGVGARRGPVDGRVPFPSGRQRGVVVRRRVRSRAAVKHDVDLTPVVRGARTRARAPRDVAMGCASSSEVSPAGPGPADRSSMDKAERTRQWVDSSERRVAGSSDALDAGAFVSAAERTAMVASFRQCMRKYRAEKVTDCDALSARLLANHPEARGNVLARAFRLVQRARRRCARRHGLDERVRGARAVRLVRRQGQGGIPAYDVDGDGVVDDRTSDHPPSRARLGHVRHAGGPHRGPAQDQIRRQRRRRLEEREFAQLLTKDDIAQRFTMRLH